MRTMGGLRFLFYGAVLLVQPTSAFADCGNENLGRFHDSHYNFVYSSSVRPPSESGNGGWYFLHRCVYSLDRVLIIKWVRLDTILLGGTSDFGSPVEVETMFPTNSFSWMPTTLYYGIDNPPNRELSVEALLHKIQLTGDFDKTFIAGEPTYVEKEYEPRTATSKFRSQVFSAPKKQELTLKIEFFSDHPAENSYTYKLKYSLTDTPTPVQSPIGSNQKSVVEPTDLKMKLATSLFKSLQKSGSAEAYENGKQQPISQLLPLRSSESEFLLRYHSAGRPTVKLDHIDIMSGDSIVASFPISFYSPGPEYAEDTGRLIAGATPGGQSQTGQSSQTGGTTESGGIAWQHGQIEQWSEQGNQAIGSQSWSELSSGRQMPRQIGAQNGSVLRQQITQQQLDQQLKQLSQAGFTEVQAVPESFLVSTKGDQRITQQLSQAGFTDVHVNPESFVVSAKDPQGNPIALIISPDSSVTTTALGGQNGGQMNQGGDATANSTQVGNATNRPNGNGR